MVMSRFASYGMTVCVTRQGFEAALSLSNFSGDMSPDSIVAHRESMFSSNLERKHWYEVCYRSLLIKSSH